MKKLERAPAWYKDELYYEATKLRKDLKLNEIIQKINEEYLYWDKVKYQKTEFDISPEVLWTIVKISRLPNAKKFILASMSLNIISIIKYKRHYMNLI